MAWTPSDIPNRSPFPRPSRLLIAVLVAGAAACGTDAHPRPEDLARSVTIYRDKWGVPHVHGATDASTLFGAMYAQAEDDFQPMEDLVVAALGRRAELDGEEALATDLLARALETEALSVAEYARAGHRHRQMAEAWAAGLNYFLDKNSLELRLLRRFEPWHYFAVGLSMHQAIPLMMGLDLEGLRETAAAPGSPPPGSNMWVVGPSKSAGGHAMVFLNPHTELEGIVEMHLLSDEGWNVSGTLGSGLPYPVMGRNLHLAWGLTVNYPDIADLFVETFDHPTNPLAYRYGDSYRIATEWSEVVRVRTESGIEERTFTFRKTHRGPVVAEESGHPLTLKIAGIEEGGLLQQWYEMSKARNLAEFKGALGRFGLPFHNVAYADVKGNIYYVYNGRIPRRLTRYDWSQPVPGSDPGTEWQGYHRLDELPQLLNPESGFLQSTNSPPFVAAGEGSLNPESFPAYMVTEPDNGRSRMSRRILSETKQFTFESWQRAAVDRRVIEAETEIPQLVAEWEALRSDEPERAAQLEEAVHELRTWDRLSDLESVAMTVFRFYMGGLVWGRQEGDGEPQLRIRCLAGAVEGLEKDWGSWKVPWGEVNRHQRIRRARGETFSDARPSLPMSGGPGYLGMIFNFHSQRVEGQKHNYGVYGSSYVSVVELAPEVRALSILPYGQSADPASKHYYDQAPLYVRGELKPSWTTLEDVRSHHVSSYHPGGEPREASTKGEG